MTLFAEVNSNALIAFAVLIAITVGVTVWAARRTRSASEFLAAGRRITGWQNGIAISGDFMSAATFLGVTGAVFLLGIEGWTVACAAVVAILLMLLLFAERMRNTGEYTVADALSFRLRERPARGAAAAATLFVGLIFLVAQLVGAGVLLSALAGTSFALSVLITGAFMLLYVVFGGMLATTWVQIIKAALLAVCGIGLTAWVLGKVGFDPTALLLGAARRHPAGSAILRPGLSGASGANVVSGALAFTLGSAALPHILVRFFTVPDAPAARRSLAWAIGVIGVFFALLVLLGFGTRYVLGTTSPEAVLAARSGGNLALPLMAEVLGGGAGTTAGDLLLAATSAVAFATILAVVSGVVISASGAVAHDLWNGLVRRGAASDREEALAARLGASAVGVVAVVISILAGSGFNVAFLVGLALSVSAAANFPALLLSFTWRRFNTTGAVAGVAVGLLSSLTLIVLSPPVWPGPDSHGSPVSLTNPTLIAVPLGFIACWLGTVWSSRREQRGRHSFAEMRFRAETGYAGPLGRATEVAIAGGPGAAG
jgi:cation/acetate symporter